MTKILITGGHLTPALAVIDYLQKNQPEVELVFVGRRYAQEATKQLSWEQKEVAARQIKFIDFHAAKTGQFRWSDFFTSVTQAEKILKREQVTHVLSFGGYLALPFALAAKLRHLPLVTHEQTRVLGRANRVLGVLADQLALSFPETGGWLTYKSTVTGNPLRAQLWPSSPAPKPAWFHDDKSRRPWLYLTGGSQGSCALNQAILPIMEQLNCDYTIIHTVGRASKTNQPLAEIDDYCRQRQLTLNHYYPRESLTAAELAYFYPRLKLAVSRAGANTVAELTAFKIPTLFIPLPHSNYNEQEKNARALVAVGAAQLLTQSELTPARLLEAIDQLNCDRVALRANLLTLPRVNNDQIAAKIVKLLLASK